MALLHTFVACVRYRRSAICTLLKFVAALALLQIPCTVRAQGFAWVWGNGYYGQLGNGLFGYSHTPGAMVGLNGVASIGGASTNGAALQNDGTVWTWGWGALGQLGNGTTAETTVPVQAQNLSGVVALAVSQYNCLAVKNDGTVWVWGYNSNGQLGNGTISGQSNTPIQVPGLTAVVAVAVGDQFCLAVKNDGTVWAWGYNSSGQLGNGTTNTSTTPTQVPGMSGVVAVAAGLSYSVALKSDGSVWSWGVNSSGQLGNGTTTGSKVPIQVTGISGVVRIATGSSHTLVVKSDGTAWGWGNDSYGLLGNGTTGTSKVPVQASGLTGVVAAAGGSSHSLFLKSDGTVWACGRGDTGQLGLGSFSDSAVPTLVNSLSGIEAIGSGTNTSYAVRSDGTGMSWGQNGNGQLGNGTKTRNITPARTGLGDVVGLAVGSGYLVAVETDGTVWTWGQNLSGQLGNGGTTNSAVAVQVPGLTGISRVAAGARHVVALKTDGTIRAWGANSNGQIGNGTSSFSPITSPVTVSNLSGAVAVAAGSSHSAALKSDGTVWTWGANSSGQLGDGTTFQRTMPVQVVGLTGVTAIACGANHTLALKNDGTVWAWGYNFWGQLGDNTVTDRTTPVQVIGLTGIIGIAGGGDDSLAVKSDGSVWAWGDGGSGQLGNGLNSYSRIPVQAAALTGVVAVASGGSHSLALRSDGTVWAWGYNSDGEVGDGSTEDSWVPIQSTNLSGATAIAAGSNSAAIAPAGGNHTPNANAGSDLNVTVPHDGDPNTNKAAFMLDGSASSDPDPGDTLTYEWKDGSTVVGATAKVNLSRAAGSYTFTLKVTDNHGASSSDSVSVTVNAEPNSAPTANAGSDQAILAAGPAANVALSGSGSDSDNDTLSFSWSESGSQIATGASPTVSLTSGSHTLKLTVTDPYGATGTDTVSVSVKRYTALLVPDVSGYAGGQVTIQAKLSVQSDGTPISSQPITFHTGGVNIGQATTDAQGIARLTYTIPAATQLGSQTIDASFAGSTEYDVSSGSGSLFIRKKPSLTAGTASGAIDTMINLKATLKFGTSPLTSRTVRFRVDGTAVGTSTTDSNGLAVLAHKLTETVGKHSLTAEFDGDSEYAPITSVAATLTVNLIKPSLAVSSITASPNQIVNLKATLKAGTTLLANQTVAFKIDGVAVGSATTNSSGVALLAHTVTETPGIHTITAEYAGDAVKYAPATGSGKLTVLIATKIMADNLKAAAGSSVVFGAKLLRTDTLTPLEVKTLNFYAGTTLIGSGLTDADGRVTITTTAPAAGVKQSITVKFPGDGQFKAASGTGSITGV